MLSRSIALRTRRRGLVPRQLRGKQFQQHGMPLFNASWIKIAFGDELSIARDVFKTFVNRHFDLQGSWANKHTLRSRLRFGEDLNEPFAAE
jgi:hypothetical protein